jgi:hypothetical protein
MEKEQADVAALQCAFVAALKLA